MNGLTHFNLTSKWTKINHKTPLLLSSLQVSPWQKSYNPKQTFVSIWTSVLLTRYFTIRSPLWNTTSVSQLKDSALLSCLREECGKRSIMKRHSATKCTILTSSRSAAIFSCKDLESTRSSGTTLSLTWSQKLSDIDLECWKSSQHQLNTHKAP